MIFFILISLSCASAAEDNQTDIVAQDGEITEITEPQVEISDFTDLNNTISNCKDNSMTLEKDYKYDSEKDSDYIHGVTIDKDNFVVDGQGHTIDGSNQAAIFTVTGNNVTLKNINFINANATFQSHDDSGGAVQFKETGSIDSCNFTSNTAWFEGAAVYFHGIGNVTNSKFEKNYARYYGGAITFKNEGLVDNCYFTNNTAHYGGGAIDLKRGNITNSIFTGNNAEQSPGGAIYFEWDSTQTCGNVINCTFIKNYAPYAGAIENTYGNFVLDNCTFTGNSATSDDPYVSSRAGAVEIMGGKITGCTFTNNTADQSGGAVYIYARNEEIAPTIENCTFINNSAKYGGAVYEIGNVNLTETTFENNYAEEMGGSLYLNDGEVTVANCSITNSSAKNGGAIMIYGQLDISNTIMENCHSLVGTDYISASSESTLITNNVTPSDLGPTIGTSIIIDSITDIIYGQTVKITFYVRDTYYYTVMQGFATILIDGKDYSTDVNDRRITIEVPNLSLGTHKGTFSYDGGKNYTKSSEEITFKVKLNDFTELNETLSNCQDNILKLTKDYGYDNDTDSAFVHGIIIDRDNFVVDGQGHTINGSDLATIFTITANNVTLKNINFINANATTHGVNDKGGAVQFQANGSVDSCNFTNICAWSDGGAIYFNENGNVTNSNFENTYSQDGEGGAIYFSKEGNVDNCNFTNVGAHSDGGAIKIGKGNIFNSNFINGTVDYNGGAIIYTLYPEKSIGKIENCTFIGNKARNSGAVDLSSGTHEINNCTFIGNSATYYVGAVMINEGNITNCRFISNDGLELAGAINIYDNANIENCTFYNNTAKNSGAVFATRPSTTINNCTFTENHADYIAGAVNFASEGSVANCTFEGNTASSGGAIVVQDALTIEDSTFKDNFASDGTHNCLVMRDSTIITHNVTPADLGPSKGVEFGEATVTNVTYGDTVTINFTVSGPYGERINNGTISLSINGKTYSSNVIAGKATIEIPGLNAGTYTVAASYYGGKDYGTQTQSVTFNVAKQNAAITASAKSYVINYAGKYSVTLKDSTGKAVAGEKVTFTLNGKTIGFATTNANGVATITLTAKILKAAKYGTKNLVIKTDGNYQATKTVKIKINKEKTKITAKKKKTFKKSKKIKRYTIKLKNSKGKAIKKVKVSLKIGKKTYKAKTNKKGKAVFKIKKFTKKGTFKAKITFKGNKYYKKVTKKVKIKIR